MGLFDKMKQVAANVSGNQTVTFTFQALPESLAQMQALPEASLDNQVQLPFEQLLIKVQLRFGSWRGTVRLRTIFWFRSRLRFAK